MAARRGLDLDAQRVVLIVLRELDDLLREGRGEQQAAAALGRALQDEFEIVAEAEIEHLVGFVEHDGLELRQVEAPPLDMVAQAPGRPDDDMRALLEQHRLAARIHAADAGDHARACLGIEPGQFALHLQGEFARRRDDQRQRLLGAAELLGTVQQGLADGEPVGDGLARAGLRGDQQVAPARALFQHGALHRRGFGIIAVGERARERRAREGKGHAEGLVLRLETRNVAKLGTGKRC